MMNNFQSKEKINTKIYNNEKLKEEQEKLKYPALNGLINQNNIDKYFIGEEENNYINNNKSTKIEYEICSYFNNEDVPDLYTPLGVISGNNYTIIPVDVENPTRIDNVDNVNHLLMDINQNISLSNKCGKVKSKCECNKIKCHICLSKYHKVKNCPKINTCNKCLQYGHRAKYCKKKYFHQSVKNVEIPTIILMNV